ncbi:MAG: hypothetical protein K2Q23_11480 [Bryobacteraceae bacterium]|nr:hypothetical protein [Bryobacteraceae bacterium]
MARRSHALRSADSGQLGFDVLLAQADTENRTRNERQAYGHLPDTMEEALPFLRDLLARHHAAMLAGDADTVETLREEAGNLAYKLNNYEPGILADEDAPGCVLARLTRAEEGTSPLWGQAAVFEVRYKRMRVRIEMDGIYGIGASHMSWIRFSAHAVELEKPFLSDTGYRSFLGVGGALRPGFTPESFAAAIIAAFVEADLKGRLKKIVPLDYRR